MIRILTHAIATMAALAFATISGSSNAYSAEKTHEQWFELNSVTQTVHRTQNLMVCINGSASKSDKSDYVVATEIVALDLTGDIILVKELRAPDFGFQCVDIPYTELLGPRFETDPMPDSVTLRIDVRRSVGANQSETVGANQSQTVGANRPKTTGEIMTIGFTGKAEQHLHIELEKVRITSYNLNGIAE
jgi:hypothetical protein